MDIQYCDRCGEMIQGGAVQDSGMSEVLCAGCGGPSSSSTAPAPVTQMIDEPFGVPADDLDNPADLSLSGVLKNDSLDLFSNDTIAMRKLKPAAGGSKTKLQLVEEDSGEQGLMTSTATAPTPAPAPVQPSADGKLHVRCYACEAKLALPMVQKRSKAKCPRCSVLLVVEPDGAVHPPSASGSAAVPQPAAPVSAPLPESPLFGLDGGSSPNMLPMEPIGGMTLQDALDHGPQASTQLEAPPSDVDISSAVLGAAPPVAAAPMPRFEKDRTVATENVILWVLVAAMPTFTGLLLATQFAGIEISSLMLAIGESVQNYAQKLFGSFGG